MYEFLIAVTIMLPKEKHSFRVYSPSEYAEPLCMARAREMAEQIKEIKKATMPYALLQMEISCSKRETRKI